ncbi:TPA: helix-turn-helix transcriptional regulator [Kluyvera ascorbata]|nr:helix-turn-helix transcriptional regulator [Kluyvera ascorbata]
MINIVIKDSDVLFQRGLTWFFSDFFSNEQMKIEFNYSLTSESVKVADIIVLSLCPGECFICLPELQLRKKGIVIGFIDDETRVSAQRSCFQDIIFIPRRAPVTQVRTAFNTAWRRVQHEGYRQSSVSCFDCRQQTLTAQQLRIMLGLYKGMSVMQIAGELVISDKTVFTHKYRAMRKFNLRSDYELMRLLDEMGNRNDWQNMSMNI